MSDHDHDMIEVTDSREFEICDSFGSTILFRTPDDKTLPHHGLVLKTGQIESTIKMHGVEALGLASHIIMLLLHPDLVEQVSTEILRLVDLSNDLYRAEMTPEQIEAAERQMEAENVRQQQKNLRNNARFN